jgi:hypothetical protein
LNFHAFSLGIICTELFLNFSVNTKYALKAKIIIAKNKLKKEKFPIQNIGSLVSWPVAAATAAAATISVSTAATVSAAASSISASESSASAESSSAASAAASEWSAFLLVCFA